MTLPPLTLPSDLASAHPALLAERAARLQAEADAANAKARLSSIEALNVHLQLLIGKLEREKHGPRRERTQRLIDQLEFAARRARGVGRRGRTERPRGRGQNAVRARLRPQASSAQGVALRRRARTHRHRSADGMCLLWRLAAVEAGRGCDGNAGGYPAPIQGDRDGAREIYLPRLRGDQSGSRTVPCDARAASSALSCWRRSCSTSSGSTSR
ncbi:UNVERIFIED_ORG: hypothetical protein GGD51_005104 [Rhizobium esperanzae]